MSQFLMSTITIDTFEVKNYKPIRDSEPINIGDMTTFIGKMMLANRLFSKLSTSFLRGHRLVLSQPSSD